jgi:hypothetical protein
MKPPQFVGNHFRKFRNLAKSAGTDFENVWRYAGHLHPLIYPIGTTNETDYLHGNLNEEG